MYGDAHNSRLLKNLNPDLYLAIQTEKVVFNAHHWCLSPDLLTGSYCIYTLYKLRIGTASVGDTNPLARRTNPLQLV